VDIKEAEMTALADQALADFAAREGISLPGDAAAAPAARSMGKESESQST
jgi:phage shock protein A